MVAYEFYCRDEKEEVYFIGVLPERRKNPTRITQESIMNWGAKVIGNNPGVKEIFFTQVAIKSV
jgi:hypothetical protein